MTATAPQSPLQRLVARAFSDDGPLAKRLPGYAPRPQQVAMALQVTAAIETPRGRLAVEAGTGIGKSLAYLIPALLSKRRVVVSTATRALQDQLYEKDVPLASAVVEELLGEAPQAERMKGRQNYLCLYRYERFAAQPTFAFLNEATAWQQVTTWAPNTATGDRAELRTLPDVYSAWSEIDASSETCIGQRCPRYEECHVVKMRRRAESARLVVANHHLLCADQRLRLDAKNDDGLGFGQVLPTADLYIVDEAHALPDTATDYFGLGYSQSGIEKAVKDVRKLVDGGGLSGDARARLLDKLIDVEERSAQLTAALRVALVNDRQKLTGDGPWVEGAAGLGAALKVLGDVVRGLPPPTGAQASGGNMGGNTVEAERDMLARRVAEQGDQTAFVLGAALSDPRFVVFADGSRRNLEVTAAPIDVAAPLSATLFDVDGSLILTSATLAAGAARDDLQPFLTRIGAFHPRPARKDGSIPKALPVSTTVVPSPFDHARRAALYCPTDMPEPDHATWPARVLEELEFLLELSRGGALVLSTSHRGLEDLHERLQPACARLGIPTLKQGDAPKQVLLETLRAHDGEVGAALFATHSFWEGVDVQGRALRLVAIDRLPFKVPSDPIVRARGDLIKQRGGDPFSELSVPEAALSLKQGAGRLLRSHDDAGVVALLDGRVRKRRYGRVFLDALPPMTRVGGRAPLQEFWRRFVAPTLDGTTADLHPPPEPHVVKDTA